MDYEEDKKKSRDDLFELILKEKMMKMGIRNGINTQEEYDEITKKVKEARKKIADIEMKRLKEEENDKHQGK